MPPNIAICYWGLTRSTRFVYKTHHEKIFNVLTKHGATYDVFLHTWQTDQNLVWDRDMPVAHDYTEQYYLNTKYYKRDDQAEFLNSIDMRDYHYAELKDAEWAPFLVRNHLCALESLKRCVSMCIATNNKYDYVMFVRPDAEILTELPYEQIFNPLNNDHNIYIPTDGSFYGYNDRFAVVKFEHVLWYSHRINSLKEYRKKGNVIGAEKYVKHIVDNHYHYVPINFNFELIRSNGKKAGEPW